MHFVRRWPIGFFEIVYLTVIFAAGTFQCVVLFSFKAAIFTDWHFRTFVYQWNYVKEFSLSREWWTVYCWKVNILCWTKNGCHSNDNYKINLNRSYNLDMLLWKANTNAKNRGLHFHSGNIFLENICLAENDIFNISFTQVNNTSFNRCNDCIECICSL